LTEQKFIAETTLHVRYAETDAMGIVHHASYIVYFEEGRSNYMRLRGSDYALFEKTGYYLIVTEINARYLKPARYGMQIIVRCWIEAMRSRAMTFAYELLDADTGDLLVKGVSQHMCITHTGKVSTFPDSWKAWMVTGGALEETIDKSDTLPP